MGNLLNIQLLSGWLKKHFDILTLLPLLIIPAASLAHDSVMTALAGEAVYKDIAVYRYFTIPTIGLSVGLVVFLGIWRKGWSLPEKTVIFLNKRLFYMLFFAIAAHTIFYSAILVLRYTTFHTSVIELGVYDQKIWNVGELLPGLESMKIAARGHFQPVTLFYGLLYKIWESPVLILALQVVTVVFGSYPLYLIAKDNLPCNTLKVVSGQLTKVSHTNLYATAIILLYLMMPACGFNSVGDFHPDHLYIAMSFWAYYFAMKKRFLLSLLFITVGAFAKEPLLMGASFFGLYLALKMGQKKLGISMALSFFLLFVIVVFYVQPQLTQYNTLEMFGFNHITGMFENPGALVDGILNGLTKKALFIWFMLMPFMFLPVLSYKEMLPALPLFFIPLVSSNPDHSNLESQYTAGLIGPIFVSYVLVLRSVMNRWGLRLATALIALSFVLMAASTVVKSPSPLSLSFWSKSWSTVWNYENYTKSSQDGALKKMFDKIPKDKDIIVVAQSNVNHAALAHRYQFYPFPHKWEKADYLVFDLNKPPMYYDKENKEKFMTAIADVNKSAAFKKVFNDSAVIVYKRLKTQSQ